VLTDRPGPQRGIDSDVPELRRDPETPEQESSRFATREADASEPVAHHPKGYAQVVSERFLGELLPVHGLVQKPSPFRKLLADPTKIEQCHQVEDPYCVYATLSTTNVEPAHDTPWDDEDVPDRRGKKRGQQWAGNARLAGAQILFAREQASLTQDKLAELSGSDKGTVSRVERGEYPLVSAGTIFDLCRVLNLDPVIVWTGKPRHQSQTPPPASSVKAKKA
jgi:DNA-binding XRE family transcriptional regulator